MSAPRVVFVEASFTGAGEDVARAALALGLAPVLLCRDRSPYPFAARAGMEVREAATDTAGAVLAACREVGALAGVGTTSDYSTAVAAAAARGLGLPGPPPDSVERCADKARMRTALDGSGLNPAWRVARDAAAAVGAAEAIGLPAIVKPSGLTGGMLVRRCGSLAEVEAHSARALGALPPGATRAVGELLVEAVVDGPEFSVEVVDGRAVGVTAKHVSGGPGFIELGHDFPAPIAPERAAALAAAAERTVAALGLAWGPAHVELRAADAEIRVLEVNPRIGGGRISDLMRLTTGFDVAHAYVSRLVGRAGEPPGPPRGFAAVRFLCLSQGGRLAGVAGLEEARGLPGVAAVDLFVAPGDLCAPTGSNLDRIGYAIACGADAPTAASRAREALDRLEVSWVRS